MHAMKPSELVLAPDKSVYHLRVKGENIADNIILVGDPSRVEMVSSFFDRIVFKAENRELKTHTGFFNNKQISVVSTGMGVDNIDIVLNEIDAAANIDLETGLIREEHRTLNIVRLGTSGGLQQDIELESSIASEYALGLDGLLHFYCLEENKFEKLLTKTFIKHMGWNEKLPRPYTVKASDFLLNALAFDIRKGITATAPGFYAPQGRELRLKTVIPDINDSLTTFSFENKKITNFEMETSALYGLSALLGHNALTICIVIANRIQGVFSNHYSESMKKLIALVLERLSALK